MHNVIINHMTEYMMKQEKETVTTVVVIFLLFYRIQFNWMYPRVFINQIATTKKKSWLLFLSVAHGTMAGLPFLINPRPLGYVVTTFSWVNIINNVWSWVAQQSGYPLLIRRRYSFSLSSAKGGGFALESRECNWNKK
jgi:hypothetical protein